jgi:MFS family permease
MAAQSPMEMAGSSASRVFGRKMDSIPFSCYQVLIIFILALVGFIEGYDLFMTCSLLMLAKAPLRLTGTDVQWLLLGPAIMGSIGGFGFSAVGDRLSRKAILPIGAIATTFFTLLIPLVQNAGQRSLTGLGAGGLVPFFMAPHTGSPTIFFGTMLLFSAIGAAVPILFGKETVGQIELVTETVPEHA